jgi:thiol-disulfide isomerase/thioredoxin
VRRRLPALAALAALAIPGCAHRSALSPEPVVSGPLPAVQLPSFPDGRIVDVAHDRGRVVVLDFWATWCEPCKDALPAWEALAGKLRGAGLQVYAVSVDRDPNQVARFLAEAPLEVPVLHDRDMAVGEKALRLDLVPTAYFVDRKGIIRTVHRGYTADEVPGFEPELLALLAER